MLPRNAPTPLAQWQTAGSHDTPETGRRPRRYRADSGSQKGPPTCARFLARVRCVNSPPEGGALVPQALRAARCCALPSVGPRPPPPVGRTSAPPPPSRRFPPTTRPTRKEGEPDPAFMGIFSKLGQGRRPRQARRAHRRGEPVGRPANRRKPAVHGRSRWAGRLSTGGRVNRHSKPPATHQAQAEGQAFLVG